MSTYHALPDYYGVLGIGQSASLDEIKRAFRKKARETHPDHNPNTNGDSDQIRLVIEAYEILSDPARRATYDRARSHPEDSASQHAAEAEARHAEAKAASYPRDWTEFQRWEQDVWPELTGTKNVTPRFLFIVIGGVATALFLNQFVSSGLANAIPGQLHEKYPTLWFWFWFWTLFSMTSPVFANLATILSGTFPVLAKSVSHGVSVPKADPNSDFGHVPCSGCDVTLRFPRTGRVRLTCPRCGTQSVQNNSAEERHTNPLEATVKYWWNRPFREYLSPSLCIVGTGAISTFFGLSWAAFLIPMGLLAYIVERYVGWARADSAINHSKEFLKHRKTWTQIWVVVTIGVLCVLGWIVANL